jgi:hypothetical protein
MVDLISDRLLRRALLGIALTGLVLGTLCWPSGYGAWAGRLWAAGTIPVVVALAVSMVRGLLAAPSSREIPARWAWARGHEPRTPGDFSLGAAQKKPGKSGPWLPDPTGY